MYYFPFPTEFLKSVSRTFLGSCIWELSYIKNIGVNKFQTLLWHPLTKQKEISQSGSIWMPGSIWLQVKASVNMYKFQEKYVCANIAGFYMTAQVECGFWHSHFVSKCIISYNFMFVNNICKDNYLPCSKSCRSNMSLLNISVAVIKVFV